MDLMASLEYVRAYIDDLLIITRGTLDVHIKKIEIVLARLRDAGLNRLTAMVAYLRPLFFELRTSLITFRIFVRCQRLIARNVADGSIDPTPNEGRMAPPWW